ncbi:MAG: AtpZ/AtpI family protein [Chloroflexi bacterium]|nr:AtpZ/AtpI family protein [Chloroflexota bacterium]
MSSKTAPDAPRSVHRFAWSVVWQVGILLLSIIGGAFILGVLLDQWAGTRTTFLMISLLLSVPLNLFAMYFYLRRKMGTNMNDRQIEEVAPSD